jgi:hypothetical protein
MQMRDFQVHLQAEMSRKDYIQRQNVTFYLMAAEVAMVMVSVVDVVIKMKRDVA